MRVLPSFSGLRAFEAAARLGSFALASDELHLTPSAVSHQIRNLETFFGRALFRRAGRGIVLTEAGAGLLRRLTRTLDELEAACAELRGGQGLALHCAPSFASEWLGPRLADFMRQHPDLEVRVSASADPVDLSRREEFDMSIVYGTPHARPGQVAEALGVEQMQALVAPGLAGADPAGLVLIESARRPVPWDAWFALNRLPPPPPGRRPSFDRAAMAIAAAAQGVGAVLESTLLAGDRLRAGSLVPLGPYRPIEQTLHYLCYRGAQAEAPTVRRFRAWLLDALS